MTSESNQKSGASISYVERVCRTWGWPWTPTAQHDDDGLDGIVYIRVKKIDPEKPNDSRSWTREFTGGTVHVQVKSGSSYVKKETQDYFEISFAQLRRKRSLWEKLADPIALIYVQQDSLEVAPTKAWWANLKSSDSYTPNGTIIVPKKNRFQTGIECRRPFARLANGQVRLASLADIDMSTPWLLPNRLNQMTQGTKFAAWEFYGKWKSVGAVNPGLGAVIVNRTGWSHMTRVGRPVSRIQASFELLPAAARIVANIEDWKVLRRGKEQRLFPDGSWAAYDYLGLPAMVKWLARAPSEVMVILKRQSIFSNEPASSASHAMTGSADRKIWFYSVYEPGRRRRQN